MTAQHVDQPPVTLVKDGEELPDGYRRVPDDFARLHDHYMAAVQVADQIARAVMQALAPIDWGAVSGFREVVRSAYSDDPYADGGPAHQQGVVLDAAAALQTVLLGPDLDAPHLTPRPHISVFTTREFRSWKDLRAEAESSTDNETVVWWGWSHAEKETDDTPNSPHIPILHIAIAVPDAGELQEWAAPISTDEFPDVRAWLRERHAMIEALWRR
jgi:hypothetical protein